MDVFHCLVAKSKLKKIKQKAKSQEFEHILNSDDEFIFSYDYLK